MAGSSFQLTTFLYGLGGGRRRIPAAPTPKQTRTGLLPVAEGRVELVGQDSTCHAVQYDFTSCGSAAGAIALADVNESLAQWLQGHEPDLPVGLANLEMPSVSLDTGGRFEWLQKNLKQISNRRALGPFTWPSGAGTPPWGAKRVMSLGSGVQYIDRMVVNTSMRQRERTLTAAAVAADLGYPVLLYVGGDSSKGWKTAVPRHVVVLHGGPAPIEETEGLLDDLDTEARLTKMAQEIKDRLQAARGEVFDPSLLIYDPATGTNTAVTMKQLMSNSVPATALGGWPHIVWMVLPVQR